MGLRDRLENAFNPRLEWGNYWLVCGLLVLACGVVAIFGDDGRVLLRYDRQAISDGEYWRLLTGHFAHLGISHLLLNMAGLILVWMLVGRYFTTLQWLIILATSISATTAGFWFIDQDMLWYVGLSGVLHGLIIAGAMAGLGQFPGESAVILVFTGAKLLWEQVAGPLPGSESASGGTVIVNAHLFGAAGGAVAAILLRRRDRTPGPI